MFFLNSILNNIELQFAFLVLKIYLRLCASFFVFHNVIWNHPLNHTLILLRMNTTFSP